jgi:hypothetical protein
MTHDQMLDNKAIMSLSLISEVDISKAYRLQFNNSDKRAKDVILGNRDTARAAFATIEMVSKYDLASEKNH